MRNKEVSFRPNGREHGGGNTPKVTSRRRALPVADLCDEKSPVSVPKKKPKPKPSEQAARHREKRNAQLEAKRSELRERRLAEERASAAQKLAEKNLYMSRIAPKSDRDNRDISDPSVIQWSPESAQLRRRRAYTRYCIRRLKRNRKPTHVPAWWDDPVVRKQAIRAAEVKVYP